MYIVLFNKTKLTSANDVQSTSLFIIIALHSLGSVPRSRRDMEIADLVSTL